MKFALIGHPVSHSFSADYLNTRFKNEGIDALYELIDLPDITEFPALIQSSKYDGFNVTIPHKKSIIPYLNHLSPEAQAVGAVNVIKIVNTNNYSPVLGEPTLEARAESKLVCIMPCKEEEDEVKVSKGRRGSFDLIGHNTDIIGFRDTFMPLLKPYHTHAIILGTGGASQAVQYVLRQLNIPFRLVNHKQLDANTITDLAPIIINTTPLGMHPHTNIAPNIDYNQLTDRHLLYDLVYNPTETRFLQLGAQHGATTQNGLAMLHRQADAALNIWLK